MSGELSLSYFWENMVMITIDEMQDMLEELIEEVPEAFFHGLNGGINLLPQRKVSPEGRNDDLLVMGEYYNNRDMGRFIVIYYGSFEQAFGGESTERIKEELRDTLFHEFTHHLEGLAGEYGLEIKDEEQLRDYFNRHKDD